MIISKITSFIFAILFSVTSIFACIPRSIWYGNDKYSVEDSENIIFNAALIADIHSQSQYFDSRSKDIRKIMCGISQTNSVPDALIIAGDISNASDAKEYRMLEWSMDTFNKIPNIIPATGNHDVRARDSYEEAIGNFFDFASFCGVKTSKAYYSTQIKGYPFIVLGSESQVSIEADISDEQVEWFENQLVEAQKTSKPIFIVSHQAMYNSHNLIYNPEAEKNWGLGDKSDEIEAIIRKYVPSYSCPVFFISGHLHYTFDEYTVDTRFCENLCCISLPSVTKTDDGGLGMSLEVYPDKIILKSRNFLTMENFLNYQYCIPVNSK